MGNNKSKRRSPSAWSRSKKHPVLFGFSRFSLGTSWHARHPYGISKSVKVLLWLVSEMIESVGSIAPIELREKISPLIEEALQNARGKNKKTAHILLELRKFYGNFKTIPDFYDRHDVIFRQKGKSIFNLSRRYCRDLSFFKLPSDVPEKIKQLGAQLKAILFTDVFPMRKVAELSIYIESSHVPANSMYSIYNANSFFLISEIKKIIGSRKIINEIAGYFPEEENASGKLIHFLRRILITTKPHDSKDKKKLIRLMTLVNNIQSGEFHSLSVNGRRIPVASQPTWRPSGEKKMELMASKLTTQVKKKLKALRKAKIIYCADENADIWEPVKMLLWLMGEMIRRIYFIESTSIKELILSIGMALYKLKRGLRNQETLDIFLELSKFYNSFRMEPYLYLYSRYTEIFVQKGATILALSELYCKDYSVIKLPDDIPDEIEELIKEILFMVVFPVKKIEELSDYMECRYAPLDCYPYSPYEIEEDFEYHPMYGLRRIMYNEKEIDEIVSYFPKEEKNTSGELTKFLEELGETTNEWDLEEHVKLIRLTTLFKFLTAPISYDKLPPGLQHQRFLKPQYISPYLLL